MELNTLVWFRQVTRRPGASVRRLVVAGAVLGFGMIIAKVTVDYTLRPLFWGNHGLLLWGPLPPRIDKAGHILFSDARSNVLLLVCLPPEHGHVDPVREPWEWVWHSVVSSATSDHVVVRLTPRDAGTRITPSPNTLTIVHADYHLEEHAIPKGQAQHLYARAASDRDDLMKLIASSREP